MRYDKGVLCTDPKRGEEVPGLSSVQCAPQNGDGPAEAGFVLMPPMALPRRKKKSEATKSSEQNALEPRTIRSRIFSLSPPGLSPNGRMHMVKKLIK